MEYNLKNTNMKKLKIFQREKKSDEIPPEWIEFQKMEEEFYLHMTYDDCEQMERDAEAFKEKNEKIDFEINRLIVICVVLLLIGAITLSFNLIVTPIFVLVLVGIICWKIYQKRMDKWVNNIIIRDLEEDIFRYRFWR
jgi:hypothetical protein